MDNEQTREQLAELFVGGVDWVNVNEILEKAKNPEKKPMTRKQKIRFCFFFFLSFLTYGIFLRKLFWQEELIASWILFCVLFIELIFLSIDIRTTKKRRMRWFLFVLWVVLTIFVPHPVWQVMVALWMSLITIGYLLFHLRAYFKNVRKISWLTYFKRWGYTFTLMSTIIFWFSILWFYSKFPFQCEQISSFNENILKQSTSWLLFGNGEEKSLFDFKKDIEELQDVQTLQEEDSLLVNELLTNFKTNMMDGFIETKNSINNKVCEAVISQIDQIYQNPVFQIWAIFWMYLIFYWVIRVFVWVITIIGFIFFTLTRWCWLYWIKRTHEVVEEVE